MRILLLSALAVILVAVAFAGVFNPIFDRTLTSASGTFYSNNIFASGNDSTHVVIATSDSLSAIFQMYVRKTSSSTPVAIAAPETLSLASTVIYRSWVKLPSAYYAYLVKITVRGLDVTNPRVRLQLWETGD